MVAAILVAAIYFFPIMLDRLKKTMEITPTTKPEELLEPLELRADELDRLLQDEDFVEVFNNFYYPDSEIIEARLVDDSQSLFLLNLESVDGYEVVEKYYIDKNVQSVWQKSSIYEKDEENSSSKITFYSIEENKVVNLLIGRPEAGMTEITIIYWELQ